MRQFWFEVVQKSFVSGNIYNCTKVNAFRVSSVFFNESIFKVPRCVNVCSLHFKLKLFQHDATQTLKYVSTIVFDVMILGLDLKL